MVFSHRQWMSQVWATFCNPVDATLCSDDIFTAFHLTSDTSLWPWLRVFFLGACPYHALTAVLHFLFLVVFLLLLTWRKITHKETSANGSHTLTSYKREVRVYYYKVILTCCLYLLVVNFGVSVWGIVHGVRSGWSNVPMDLEISASVQAIAWCIIFLAADNVRRGKRKKFPVFLRAWWSAAVFLSILSLPSRILLLTRGGYLLWAAWLDIAAFPATLFLGFVALLGQTGVEAVADELQSPLLDGVQHGSTDAHPVAAYATASIFSLATLSWLNPLLAAGAQNPLESKDLPFLAPEDRADVIYKMVQQNWDRLKSQHPSQTPSIVTTLARSFWKHALWTAMFAFFNVFASYVGPYLINDFVEYLGGRRRFSNEGFILVSIFFLGKMVENLMQRQWYLGIQFVGLRIRGCLTAFVFRKGLRLSSQSRKSHTSAEIINYMSVDVQRISDFSWYLNQIWILPLEVGLALAILYKVVGMAWVAALIAACFTLFLNTPLEKKQEKYQDEVMTAKDARMKATAECLRNMRVLKLQAWEKIFLARIEELRQREYSWLVKDCLAKALSVYTFWVSPILIAIGTFGTCVFLGIPLTAGRILSAIATFRVLQDSLSQFPELVSFYAQTKVSVDRIWRFLQEEELPKDAVIHVPKNANWDGLESDIAVQIEGGEFTWDPTVEAHTLTGIELHVKRGARVAVCGTVGSGKSSLISCILGEVPKLSGTVRVSGSTAYVGQSAWIQTGKVEDNIRFGAPMDRTRYDSVLEACALKKDLELWAFGDQTEIGERGINMSGGQKQRIQLARALYQDADIYLLDDPFSAVDAHTGSQLFRECILGMLGSKTVVYVTHQVEFLPAADLILVLESGMIVQAGKYDELLQAGTNFRTLVEAHTEAIDGMDMDDSLEGDDYSTAPHSESEESFRNGSENHSIVDDTDRLQKQKSLRTQRSVSIKKQNSKKEKDIDPTESRRQLIEEEERERGIVKLSVYWSYITSVSRGVMVTFILISQICFQVLQIGSNYWMVWASPSKEGDVSKMSSTKLILVFAALSFGSSLFVICRSLLVALFGVFAAQKYFLDMTRCLFKAPMSFFDSTPAGRILNRASSDQSKLDSEISFNLSGLVVAAVQLVGILTVMSQVGWAVVALFLPVAGVCLWLQRYYMASAREVARLLGIEKSPILNHYGESIAGAATIRAFGQDKRFMDTNLQLFDNYARPSFFNMALIEWIIFRMENWSTCVFVFCMLLVVLLPSSTIDPSMAGLAVTYGLNLNMIIAWFVWILANVETKIISVERIQQYTHIPSEAPLVIDECRPPKDWPSHGTIELQQLEIRYSSHSPLVLHGITCKFGGGKKVGVVGRTGSGKSTLIQALFRMVEPAGGKILIDGLDITAIGLHDLRSRLGIIPQDPTLFEGTMRTNLDPLQEHSDAEVWEALDKCQLGDVLRAKEGKLDSPVGENGENWSVGQRQLVCLGRTLLKRTRILVLDEATASIDSATDNVIQRTLRTEFRACTVITIAHRIPTVVDSDFVLVLSDGRIAEYDVPAKLLENKSSMFAKLVAEYR